MKELRSQTEDAKETQRLVPAGGYCFSLCGGSGDVEFREYGRTPCPVQSYGGDIAITEHAIQGSERRTEIP